MGWNVLLDDIFWGGGEGGWSLIVFFPLSGVTEKSVILESDCH